MPDLYFTVEMWQLSKVSPHMHDTWHQQLMKNLSNW